MRNKMDLLINTILTVLVLITIVLITINYIIPVYNITFMYGESMQPTINKIAVGVIDSSENEVNDYTKGDLITFTDSLDNRVVHRVTEVKEEGIVIKGDNRTDSLFHYVEENDSDVTIHGKVVYKIAY